MENKPVVTITGVSGYLGSHVCLYFLKSGEFKVRGTVRSKTNAKKIEPLKKAFGSYFDELELVEADLTNKQSLINVCEGATYVVHTASPVPWLNSIKDVENELFRPAIDGTIGILEGCRIHKVKRCVYTASLAGIMYPKGYEKRNHFDHNDWSDPTAGTPYIQSKARADAAAWDYMKKLPGSEKFEFSVIYPGAIVGPSLTGGESPTEGFAKMMMTGEMSSCPKVFWSFIDVRDCAESHYKALKIPEADGQRFPMVHRGAWLVDMGRAMNAHFGKPYSKIPTTEMPKCLAWVGSFFNEGMKLMYSQWGQEIHIDNSQARRILQMTFIEPEQSFIDMGESMIQTGVVKELRK